MRRTVPGDMVSRPCTGGVRHGEVKKVRPTHARAIGGTELRAMTQRP